MQVGWRLELRAATRRRGRKSHEKWVQARRQMDAPEVCSSVWLLRENSGILEPVNGFKIEEFRPSLDTICPAAPLSLPVWLAPGAPWWPSPWPGGSDETAHPDTAPRRQCPPQRVGKGNSWASRFWSIRLEGVVLTSGDLGRSGEESPVSIHQNRSKVFYDKCLQLLSRLVYWRHFLEASGAAGDESPLWPPNHPVE